MVRWHVSWWHYTLAICKGVNCHSFFVFRDTTFQVACCSKFENELYNSFYLDCELQLVNSVMDSCIILFIHFTSIGHLLGLSHDDSKFCEENFGSMEDKRLMSSILTSIDASKPWSKCTSATITEFFDDGHGMYYHTLCQLRVSFYCDLFF